MAGDFPVVESAVVAPQATAESVNAVIERIEDTGGRVRHRYGPRVLIGQFPEGIRPQVSGLGVPVAAPTIGAPDPDDFADLDETGRLGLQALRLRETADFISAKARRLLNGAAWDTPDAKPPDAPSGTGTATATEDAGSPAQAEAQPTSSRMKGTIAVGIIIVQGPTADLKFTDAERTKVVAEVQSGLNWLASWAPIDSVSWVYEIKTVQIAVAKGSDSLSQNGKEELWRNPTMTALGFSADFAGVSAYVQDLRNRLGTDWTYCAFFTKYPLGHFAYANIGGPRLVMNYDVDGWGIDNMDRVFAHETGHIFGAPDEYASSGCNCGGAWGVHGLPNSNCENCAPDGGVSCIMRANTWDFCGTTIGHFGWWP